MGHWQEEIPEGVAQRLGVHFNQNFCCCPQLGLISILVVIAINFSMSICQFDITLAYLNGEQNIFLEKQKKR